MHGQGDEAIVENSVQKRAQTEMRPGERTHDMRREMHAVRAVRPVEALSRSRVS